MLMIFDWKTQKYLTLTGKGGLAPVNYQEFGTVWPESQYAKLVARWEARFPTLRVLYVQAEPYEEAKLETLGPTTYHYLRPSPDECRWMMYNAFRMKHPKVNKKYR